MIKELLIKNFILIDELKLRFDEGFNVFIGETGAGKSIILKAIDTALGAKTNKDVLFDPSKNALIEVTFFDKDNETVISREISNTGTKCRLNGALVTLDIIKEQREFLLDIHSQHQTYTTLQQKFHINLLDSYICQTNPDFKKTLEEYKKDFKEFKEVEAKLNKLNADNEQNIQKADFLKFQIDEIEKAGLEENEEEELNKELEILSNIEELKNLTYGAYWAMGGQDNSILEALGKVKFSVSKAAEFDDSIKETETAFYDALETLKDTSDTLRNYSEGLDFNPERLNMVSERLELIEKLKRKYGNIFESLERFNKELLEIETDANSVDELKFKYKELNNRITTNAEKLHVQRSSHAEKLSILITNKLKQLEFKSCEFKIQIDTCEKNHNGTDRVEFLITTNVSKNLMPLDKVASGGEISRVMLAIKCIFAQSDNVKTLIFDEIDTGISGKASVAVSNAIVELAEQMQIFAVTHQPIIAAHAKSYFWVMKKQEDSTQISVKKLNESEKPNYLAMLASGEINETSVSFAKELLNS